MGIPWTWISSTILHIHNLCHNILHLIETSINIDLNLAPKDGYKEAKQWLGLYVFDENIKSCLTSHTPQLMRWNIFLSKYHVLNEKQIIPTTVCWCKDTFLVTFFIIKMLRRTFMAKIFLRCENLAVNKIFLKCILWMINWMGKIHHSGWENDDMS